jgi:hypothetical protein
VIERGEISIQWLERRLESLTSVAPPADGVAAAAIAAALLADEERSRQRLPAANGAAQHDGAVDTWRQAALREGIGER